MDAPLLALTRGPAQPTAGRSPNQATADNMRQLVQLRWIAVGGQLVAILVTAFVLGVDLPVVAMLGVVVLLAVANLFVWLSLKRFRVIRGELLLALLLDMAALTAQLYFSGGANNPFTSLYLLQVALGAILVSSRSVWLLIAASWLCFGFLSVSHWPLVLPADLWIPAAQLWLFGEWLSFAMVATLLVLFITRISRNLRARDAYVAELGKQAAEEDGVVRMGLFASGAAHELGTPLSSLSVLLADWQRHPALRGDPVLQEELEDARAELQRCKDIVSNILHSAGQARGEAMASVPVRTLLDEIAGWWRAHHAAVPLAYDGSSLDGMRVPAEPALRQAILNLMENAAESSPSGVGLNVERTNDRIGIAVTDRGSGFPEDQLYRVGQLYQSTKGPGHGLGLFLASNVARRLGGSLEAANSAEGGAVVRLLLPLARAETKER